MVHQTYEPGVYESFSSSLNNNLMRRNKKVQKNNNDSPHLYAKRKPIIPVCKTTIWQFTEKKNRSEETISKKSYIAIVTTVNPFCLFEYHWTSSIHYSFIFFIYSNKTKFVIQNSFFFLSRSFRRLEWIWRNIFMASARRHYQVQGELWARCNITSAKKT